MFKSSLTVFFLILFAHSCNAHSLIEEVELIEIPGENREESSVVETRGAIEVPDEDNGDKTNVGEKDFEVDEGHLKEQGKKKLVLSSFSSSEVTSLFSTLPLVIPKKNLKAVCH